MKIPIRQQSLSFIFLISLGFMGKSFLFGAPLSPVVMNTPPVKMTLEKTSSPDIWEKKPTRFPPFFWYESSQEQQRKMLMVSLLYWDIMEEDTSHRLFLPFFYRWQEKDRHFFVSLPFIISSGRPREKWMLAGVYFRHQNPELTRTALVPFYWQKSRLDGGRVTSLLPFVFYDYRSHRRDRIDQVSLLGWYRRRGDKNMGLILNYGWMNEPHGRFRTIFPFYWHVKGRDHRLDVFGPFYYKRQEPFIRLKTLEQDGKSVSSFSQKRAGMFPFIGMGWGNGFRSNYLFPFYYFSKDEDQRSFITLLYSRIVNGDLQKGHLGLYFYSHDPDLRVDGLFPFWHHRVSTDGFEKKTQTLNFYSRLENEDYFQTLFPLYGYWSNPEESKFLSWGIWRKRNQEGTAGWSYLYFWKKDFSGDDTKIFFPLYWHFRRSPDWGLDVFFPFYTRYQDGKTSVTAVPPFIWKKTPERNTWSFLFLYWRDQEDYRGSTSFFPFFHSNYNPQRRMFFSPLLWLRTGVSSREGILPPVYWYTSSEKKRLIVFPVYWDSQSPKKSLKIIPPYYRWKKENRLSYGFFPLWGRHSGEEEKGGYLFPFYWYSADEQGNGIWVIPPILGYLTKSGKDTEEEQFNLQYLLLGHVHKARRSMDHGFFPLYRYVQKDDFKNFWAPRGIALMAWEKRGDYRKGYLFPYVWSRSPKKNWDLVLPLWYHSSTYEVEGSTETRLKQGKQIGETSIFFPLYWKGKNEERRYRYFFPLFVSYRESQRKLSVVTPLWISYNGKQGGKFRLLFPLYWRFLVKQGDDSDKKGERDIRVFGPAYSVKTKKDQKVTKTFGIAPIFSRTYTGPRDHYFEILGGLFGRDVREGKRRFRILYFFYTRPKSLKNQS